MTDIRLSELLTYTARFGTGGTGPSLDNPRDDGNCVDPLDASWFPNPDYRGPETCQNSAFGNIGRVVASKAADELSFIVDSRDLEAVAKYDQYVKALWMSSIDLGDTSCLVSDPDTGEFLETTAYYSLRFGERLRRRFPTRGPGTARLLQQWKLSFHRNDLLYFLSAARYGKVLRPELNDYLNSKSLTNPNGSQNIFVAWNGDVDVLGTGERALRKAGVASGKPASIRCRGTWKWWC